MNRPAQAAARDHSSSQGPLLQPGTIPAARDHSCSQGPLLPCSGFLAPHPHAQWRGSLTSACGHLLAAAVPAKSKPGLKGQLALLARVGWQPETVWVYKELQYNSCNKALTTPSITGAVKGLSSEFVKVKSGTGDTQVSQSAESTHCLPRSQPPEQHKTNSEDPKTLRSWSHFSISGHWLWEEKLQKQLEVSCLALFTHTAISVLCVVGTSLVWMNCLGRGGHGNWEGF